MKIVELLELHGGGGGSHLHEHGGDEGEGGGGDASASVRGDSLLNYAAHCELL